MTPMYEVRADYNRDTIVVYQAYSPEIALPAAKANRFVPPFSMTRMTWIKPSFLWMMERCGWGTKPQQEHVLRIRMHRAGFDEALSLGALTHPSPHVYKNHDEWQTVFSKAPVNVQWDPERSLRGGKLEHRSIQVGLGSSMIERYVNEWIVKIDDISELVAKIRRRCEEGRHDKAKPLLPEERPYPVSEATGKRLGMTA